MRVLFINCVCGIRSTGRICEELATQYEKNGAEVRIAYGRVDSVSDKSKKWAIRIGGRFELFFHALMTRLFDRHGSGICSRLATRRFLRWAEDYNPDVVWLHNLHGYYLNYELLFKWIKRHPEMEVKWTLHDCWAFTGHCSYFTMSGCGKWKAGCCGKCAEKGEYPKSWGLGAAKSNWERKRKAFCGVKKMTLITPSKWLADLTRKSFLKEYPVEVIHNTINTSVFKPTPSDVKTRLGSADKKLILGVASTWDRRKGLDDFLAVRRLLSTDFAVAMVGLTQRQIDELPEGIIGVARTNSVDKLVQIYSAADWFFNPTREDNYPTVNLEAVACGCNVVTYDTGGCSETVEGVENAWVLQGAEKSPEGFVRVMRAHIKEVR